MSQKSSVPQAVSFVSQVLKRDTLVTARQAVEKSTIRSSRNIRPKVAPGSTEGHQWWNVLQRKAKRYFFTFKSLPLKVLTIAAMSPSWVS
jgi:hypothetical protein